MGIKPYIGKSKRKAHEKPSGIITINKGKQYKKENDEDVN